VVEQRLHGALRRGLGHAGGRLQHAGQRRGPAVVERARVGAVPQQELRQAVARVAAGLVQRAALVLVARVHRRAVPQQQRAQAQAARVLVGPPRRAARRAQGRLAAAVPRVHARPAAQVEARVLVQAALRRHVQRRVPARAARALH
jgi:hypothetical protein